MEVGIEFVLYMVGMARLLVVFFKFKESQERRDKQSLGRERRDPLFCSTLARTSEDGFQEFIYFVTDRSFTADGGQM